MRIVIPVTLLFGFASTTAHGVRLQNGVDSLAPRDQQKKPNIVYMLIDDLGWADLSYRGGDEGYIQTPQLEHLKNDGILLNRLYAYSWCGPSRSSLLTGRLPVHVNVNHTNSQALNRENPASGANGIPSKMSIMSMKMKEAGYKTHYNGKWGVGFARPDMMPLKKGFDTFLGYLHDSNDYYTGSLSNSSIEVPSGCELAGIGGITDLYKNNGPAHGLNGTMWEDELFIEETLKNIEEHDASEPLFLFHAFHSIHSPLNPPNRLQMQYNGLNDPTRRAYASMVTYVDGAIGQVVALLKRKGMWEDTIMVVSSDNGGPIYPGKSLEMFGGANNHPLRGGKTADWEGGIRVNGFVTGGLIPQKMRGTQLDDYIHLADWYSTFCALAQVDPTDELAAKWDLPPIDSINMWPLLSGEVKDGTRTSMHISPVTLIDGDYKLLIGSDPGSINQHTEACCVTFNVYGVGYGVGAIKNMAVKGKDCTGGCLYNIKNDPREAEDISAQFPEVTQKMLKELGELNKSVFQPDRGTADIESCEQMSKIGFYVPFSEFPELK